MSINIKATQNLLIAPRRHSAPNTVGAMQRQWKNGAAWFALATLLIPAGATSVSAEAQRYLLTLEITWSAETHSYRWPDGGGHISRLIGATHHSRYIMFADGRTATSGLKSVAENGRTAIIRSELDEADRRGRIGEVFAIEGLDHVPGEMKVVFEVTSDHSLVSFVTMIAPSPDWFTGLNSIELWKDGEWIDELRLPLWGWDSGTDSGLEYISTNEETQPAESIRLLASPHFLNTEGLETIGSATFSILVD